MIGATDTFLIGNAPRRGYNAATVADLNANTRIDYGYTFSEGPLSLDYIADTLFDWEAVKGSFIAEADGADGPLFNGDHDFVPVMHNRTGHIFGVHKSGYEIHQYRETLLDNVAVLLDQDLGGDTAATLDKGSRAFVTVSTPDNITGPGGITHHPYLVVASSHDGSIATTYKWSTILPVCRNTFAMALAQRLGTYKIKHTKNSEFKVLNAREALGVLFSGADAFNDALAVLLDSKVTDADWKRVKDAILPLPDKDGRGKTISISKRVILDDLWTNDPRVAPWTGTAWGVVQAISTATQHEFTVRGKDREARNLGAGTLGAFDKTDAATLTTLRDLDLIPA